MITKLFKRALVVLSWIICRFCPVKRNKIVISNFYGRGYGDNPKYIAEALIKKEDKLNIIWLVKNKRESETLPSGIQGCQIGTFKSVYHLSTASVWVDNCRKGFTMFKRRKQLYIQTWHGFALKQIEKDVESHLSANYVKNARKDSKMIDCIISDSSFMTKVYKTAFWYDGEVLELGSPRNDVVINKNHMTSERVHSAFELPSDRKIVLYAPTFRANKSLAPYSIDSARLIKACEEKFGGRFSLLVRLHPSIADMCDFIDYDGTNIINASPYPDIQELLSVADVVISDYSSLMFDFALSYKPCFQFATDIAEYKSDRNFYFELDKLPLSIATNNDELEHNIKNFNEEDYKNNLTSFFRQVGMITSGNASQKCADMIVKHCVPKGK